MTLCKGVKNKDCVKTLTVLMDGRQMLDEHRGWQWSTPTGWEGRWGLKVRDCSWGFRERQMFAKG